MSNCSGGVCLDTAVGGESDVRHVVKRLITGAHTRGSPEVVDGQGVEAAFGKALR